MGLESVFGFVSRSPVFSGRVIKSFSTLLTGSLQIPYDDMFQKDVYVQTWYDSICTLLVLGLDSVKVILLQERKEKMGGFKTT